MRQWPEESVSAVPSRERPSASHAVTLARAAGLPFSSVTIPINPLVALVDAPEDGSWVQPDRSAREAQRPARQAFRIGIGFKLDIILFDG
jgi:signal transduction protein with GAF and PtsI domain